MNTLTSIADFRPHSNVVTRSPLCRMFPPIFWRSKVRLESKTL